MIDSEILLDLWKDCVDYDWAHPGATRSARLRNVFRRASRALRESLTAVMDNDQNFIREHESLKRCPENLLVQIAKRPFGRCCDKVRRGSLVFTGI